MNIGDWVRRVRGRVGEGGLALTKWHLVDSVVAGDAFTRCGRRMRQSGPKLEVSDVMPLTRMIGQPQLCKQCDRSEA